MPWKIEKRDEKYVVVKEGTGEVEGTHETEEEAKAQVRALYASEGHLNAVRLAFESFSEIDLSKPIKLFPTGPWHRGDRVLDITPGRLQEMERNHKSGLPRYTVPFTLDHKDDNGKFGDVEEVAYLEDGHKGPGLYATRYKLTDRGVKAVQQDGYDAVSAEVVWSLNGAKYQDPETGQEFDNVLTGVSFTPYPFFGHKQVGLHSDENHIEWFSADPKRAKGEAMAEPGMMKRVADMLRGMLKMLSGEEEHTDEVTPEEFAEWDAAYINDLPDSAFLLIEEGGEKEDGKTTPRALRHFPVRNSSGEVDLPHLRNALARIPQSTISASLKARALERAHSLAKEHEVGEAAEEAAAIKSKEAEKMADEKKAEEFVAQLATANGEIERLKAEGTAGAEKLRVAEEQLHTMKLTARKAELKSEAEKFVALPIKPEVYVEKFVALEAVSPELATWLKEQFAAIDVAMKEAGLLSEVGTERSGEKTKADQFLALIGAKQKELGGGAEKYADAFDIVQNEHPDLARAYLGEKEG